MALASESWLPQAQRLRPGERAKVEHDCGPGRTLHVEHVPGGGLRAWCYRCNDKGWAPGPVLPIAERLALLAAKHEADRQACGPLLPKPALLWPDWPDAHRLWLLKAGLGSLDATRLGAYYHPPTDRVVLPVLEGLLPVFWQARAVDGRQPKYLSPQMPAGGVVPQYGAGPEVTLTEDILSAYKVGSTPACEGWAMMGTSLKPAILAKLLARKVAVNVWTDPDPAGRRAASKIVTQLRGLGLACRVIESTKDPKLLHRADIKELLT